MSHLTVSLNVGDLATRQCPWTMWSGLATELWLMRPYYWWTFHRILTRQNSSIAIGSSTCACLKHKETLFLSYVNGCEQRVWVCWQVAGWEPTLTSGEGGEWTDAAVAGDSKRCADQECKNWPWAWLFLLWPAQPPQVLSTYCSDLLVTKISPNSSRVGLSICDVFLFTVSSTQTSEFWTL